MVSRAAAHAPRECAMHLGAHHYELRIGAGVGEHGRRTSDLHLELRDGRSRQRGGNRNVARCL